MVFALTNKEDHEVTTVSDDTVQHLANIFKDPESLMLDSGAAVHVATPSYASDYPV